MQLIRMFSIMEFLLKLKEFVETYDREGPGSVGHDMDRGIKLMEQYVVKFDEMEAQRLELGK